MTLDVLIMESITNSTAHPRSAWGVHHKEADEVGDRFALFALGSLANMATLNPVIQIPGTVPYLGHSLKVYEPWFAILWAFIVGSHLALLSGVVIWARKRGHSETSNRELHSVHNQANNSEESQEGLVRDQHRPRYSENV